MDAEKSKKINGHIVEQFYWAGKHVVYIDNRKSDLNFDDAVKSCSREA